MVWKSRKIKVRYLETKSKRFRIKCQTFLSKSQTFKKNHTFRTKVKHLETRFRH